MKALMARLLNRDMQKLEHVKEESVLDSDMKNYE